MKLLPTMAAFSAALATLLVTAALAFAGESDGPRELGKIAWHRGYEKSVDLAKESGRPLLVLFQEVPGCDTCTGYGDRVLSHPLVVEAVESHFVPVAVYNNVEGDDKKTLERFGERAWSNPVVRVVAVDGSPLAARVAGEYTVGGIATAMVAALEKTGADVPGYLRLLVEEWSSRATGVKRATFAMHCFWEGEMALAKIPGVVSTAPGFLDKLEVVEVEYDPKRVDYASLVRQAQTFECASKIFTRTETQQKVASALVPGATVRSDADIRPDKEPKYYLSRTEYRSVPMTPLQAAQVNSRIGAKKDPTELLSPRQRALLATIRKHPAAAWPNLIGAANLPRSWAKVERLADSLADG